MAGMRLGGPPRPDRAVRDALDIEFAAQQVYGCRLRSLCLRARVYARVVPTWNRPLVR